MNEQWVFSFYMYLYTYVRKAKNWVLQNWCFRTVVLGKTLESPLDCGGQSILKEISPEYSLEALMLKLKLQYFGHLMRSTDSLEKTLMLGKAEGEEDDRGSDGWMALSTRWTCVWAAPGVGEGPGSLVCYSPWGCKESDMNHPKVTWGPTPLPTEHWH